MAVSGHDPSNPSSNLDVRSGFRTGSLREALQDFVMIPTNASMQDQELQGVRLTRLQGFVLEPVPDDPGLARTRCR